MKGKNSCKIYLIGCDGPLFDGTATMPGDSRVRGLVLLLATFFALKIGVNNL